MVMMRGYSSRTEGESAEKSEGVAAAPQAVHDQGTRSSDMQ
jgi:hypothetical protein